LLKEYAEKQAEASNEYNLLDGNPPWAEIGAAVLALDRLPSQTPPDSTTTETSLDVSYTVGDTALRCLDVGLGSDCSPSRCVDATI